MSETTTTTPKINNDEVPFSNIESGNHHSKKKRGMKPRSKRNRKRPRSQAHALPDNVAREITVRPLELDGKPLLKSSPMWLRFVEPYPYTFSSFAKARWVGRTVLDVYATEFGSYPKSYYEAAIQQGRILVSDQQVETTHVIKGGDVLSHTVHRHEPGVMVQSPTAPFVTVIQETRDVLVVDKPSTVPVHPCGGYHEQSLMNMLEKHYGHKLYTIHRLDRLTSGLVILGKTSHVAQQWGKAIMNRDCQKVYLARVKGKFPMNCPDTLKRLEISVQSTCRASIPWHGEWEEVSDDNQSAGVSKHATEVSELRKLYAHAYWIADEHSNLLSKDAMDLENVFHSQHSVDDWLESMNDTTTTTTTTTPTTEKKNGTAKQSKFCWFHLACPTRIAQHKDGICEAGSFQELDDDVYKKSVKPAASSFGVVSYDAVTDSTLLICRPHTGRTHQLRLHLQHLGHPIANDPNYGGDMFYCNESGREASKRAQDKLDILVNSEKAGSQEEKTTVTTATDVPATEAEVQNGIVATTKGPEESIHEFIRRTCVWCKRTKAVSGADRAIFEFMIRSPGIWLHALQYSFTPADGARNKDEEKAQQQQRFRAPLPSWHIT